MKLEWRPLARGDLADLMTHIAGDSPAAAYRVHDEIRRQIEQLPVHPDMGRPGRVRGTRELVIVGTPYLAAYRVADGMITILRLLHGAQRWPRVF